MYFHIIMKTFQMQNYFEHMYFWTPFIFRVHKTLRLAFIAAFQGVSLGSFYSIDSESEVYF